MSDLPRTPRREPGAKLRSIALPIALVVLVAGACGSGDASEGGAASGSGGATGMTTDAGSVHPDDGASDGPIDDGSQVPPCARQGGCAGLAGGNWTSLPGFVGPVADTGSATPVVDEATVRTGTAPTGTWQAVGLATAGDAPVGGPATVEATLLDAGGAEVGRTQGPLLVTPLRPGEPAPFRLDADVPADRVASVAWSVVVAHADDPAGPAADPASRALRLAVFWTRPAGDDRPVAIPGYVDPEGARPFLLYGEGTVEGDDAVEAPRAVAAWLDDEGRVLAVAEAPLRRPGTDAPVSRLEPGGTADLVLTVDDPALGAQLDDRNPILWGVGS